MTARQETTTVEAGGLVLPDPYQWLEVDTPEVLAWQRNEDDAATAYLHRWAGWEDLRAAVATHAGVGRLTVPRFHGRWRFRLVRGDGPRPHLEVADGEGASRVLLDPADHGPQANVDWWYPSPDGGLVAVGLSSGGDEQSVVHVVDTATGEVLADRVPHASQAHVAWLPDGSGFYLNAGIAPDSEDGTKYLWFHEVGGATSRDDDLGPLPFHSVPRVSRDGRWVVVLSYPAAFTFRLRWGLDRQGGGPWRELLAPGTAQCDGDVVGNEFVAVCREGAPRGRLVAIPLEGDGPWRELLPEGEPVLRWVRLAGDGLLLEELVDTVPRLRVLRPDGTPQATVPLEGVGALQDASVEAGRAVWLAHSTFVSSSALLRYDLANGALDCVEPPERTLDGLEVKTTWASAGDGTRLPAHLVYRPAAGDGPRPVLIHAYGGYNHVLPAGYLGRWAPFVEAGGVYVHAHLRGGGEYGDAWWQAGRMATKQQTFDDLFALADHLVATGVTEPGRIGLYGASNGGLTAGAAVTQRPDLFGAVVAAIPVLDLLRALQDPYTASGVLMEYGDPRVPEDSRIMAAYSPYHRVTDGVAYPATLAVCGETDIRCPAWHARKFVARMQGATAGDAPILLRVWPAVGHHTGADAEAQALVDAEPVAFLLRVLGRNLAQERRVLLDDGGIS